MNIADRIQNLRKTKGISQEELADKVGVSRQSVSKWESEQSLPEIDKVIIMSDFFDVTTDYILKGIEQEKKAVERVDAKLFVWIATALNFIGLVLSLAVWQDEQTLMALMIGLIIMAVGCAAFGVGMSFATQNVEKAKRHFWMLNIWMPTLILLSAIYNAVLSYPIAPYPLLVGPYYILQLPIFWVAYIVICATVFLLQVKKGRK
jgi:transcriptional regulator with XRE-family HTH domain